MDYTKKRLLIFGTGKFYKNRKRLLYSFLQEIDIVGYLDNNPQEKEYLDDLPVVHPERYKEFEFDKIILMSKQAEDMKTQLIELGCERVMIWEWDEAYCELSHGRLKIYIGQKNDPVLMDSQRKGELYLEKKILIISTFLNYNGGTMAAVYAALALKKTGYKVILASPGGVLSFIEEVKTYGLDIVICPSLPYVGKEERYWISQFDIVIVNVFQMIKCACDISQFMPVIWWLHENSGRYDDIYKVIRNKYPQYIGIDKISKVTVLAVSTIAKNNFNYYYPNGCEKILSFGIPDDASEIFINESKDIMIFAIIGAVIERKGQDLLLNAFQQLSSEIKSKIELWIIGAYSKEDSYTRNIFDIADKYPQIKIFGNLTRNEMLEAYKKIDVVVCASREETMSIAVMEGMMHQKVCITTTSTGVADYIDNGINGFIVPSEDIDALAERIGEIVCYPQNYFEIAKNARKAYEKYFTIDSFSKRIRNAVEEKVPHE